MFLVSFLLRTMVTTDNLVHFFRVSLTFRDKSNYLTAACFLMFFFLLLEIIVTEKERNIYLFLMDVSGISCKFGKELWNMVHKIGNNGLQNISKCRPFSIIIHGKNVIIKLFWNFTPVYIWVTGNLKSEHRFII